ncbi:MAG TPA: hypothetical protein VJJ78_02930 [Candidatus Saccharimonadales bacterium]|uniref:Uncharacterized protein n=1 Tax=Candidatus Yanofskybacteria bacterium RIFCSPHIGHO2_01_FULL_41_21 TaxID=1802660 RepID=A0A1F8EBC6_9BACT|nr:MAG: hypothetical protein A2735_00055 [Candidatus Yanofskybacteria bacterium RIFCSPHIGHO2_01_FULL_41_21]HLB66521.1 hypothetical protein [Candidatus Saccharimonadales bacterium]
MIKIILAVVVVAVGVAGYFAFVNKSSQVVQQTSTPTPTKTVQAIKSPTPAPSATTDWKTYTSSKYGYSVQYPSIWTSKVNSDQGLQSEVAIQGSEGSITIYENFDFGGGLCSSVGTLTQVSTAAGSFMGCVTTSGLTVSGDSSFLSNNNNQYFLKATWTTSSKQKVLQALSTFKFTK